MNALAPWAAPHPVAASLQTLPDAELRAYKRAFAEALLRCPTEPFRAATAAFGMNTALAMQASQQWVFDPEIYRIQTELLREHGEDAYLPSKAVLIQRIMALADNEQYSAKERLAAYDTVAELRGFKPKKDEGLVTINNNKVMIVERYGTDDDWSEAARAQQAKLIENAG